MTEMSCGKVCRGGLALLMRGSHYSKPDIFEKAKKCLYQSTINEGLSELQLVSSTNLVNCLTLKISLVILLTVSQLILVVIFENLVSDQLVIP